jgi:nucleoside 2-deoxyribosyltransferase
MIIAGGTYLETVVQPDSRDLMGSGVRAAAALSKASKTVSLITAVDEISAKEAEWVSSALHINRLELLSRTEPVGFSYMTPISSPSINGLSAEVNGVIESEDNTTLLFGFVERGNLGRKIDSVNVLLDPQKPRDTDPLNLDGITYERLAIVANRSETLQLGGESSDIRSAARKLLSTSGASSVVTKRGAAGCLVTWVERGDIHQATVAAYATPRVWPIGSGDVFSAGYAYALDSGADYVESARVASRCAAHWCATRRPDIPEEILHGENVYPLIEPRAARVYLAGPFFTTGERWLIETVRDELRSLGVEPWSPVHEVGPGVDIAEADLAGLESCDAVLALLDHGDSGTIFEVGWAAASDIPIVGFGNVVEPEGMKMLGGSSVELHRDLSTACYRAAWAAMGMTVMPGWMTS